MSAIDGAKAHFGAIKTQRMEVREWGEDGQPLVIFWQPITLAEKQRLANIGEKEGYISRLADCLVMKALDADGKKLFTIADKHALRHQVDPDVLSRIVIRMMAAPTEDDAEKNSEGTTSSA